MCLTMYVPPSVSDSVCLNSLVSDVVCLHLCLTLCVCPTVSDAVCLTLSAWRCMSQLCCVCCLSRPLCLKLCVLPSVSDDVCPTPCLPQIFNV